MDEGSASVDETGPATATAVHRGPRPYTHVLRIREHELVADEMPAYGGDDHGPDPTELLAAALAACTSMTMRAYAERKGWDLGDASVTVEFHDGGRDGAPRYSIALDLPGSLDDAQAERVVAIAARCPTRRALTPGATFDEQVRRAPLDQQPQAAQAV